MPKRAFPVLLIALLGLHWWLLVGPGRVDLTRSDWPRQVAYFNLLAESVSSGRAPVVATAPVFDLGPWLWGNLEAPMAPHHVLFARWGAGAAVGLTAVLMAALGVVGCLRLARRFDVSPQASVLLAVALGINGVITAHVAAGHLAWLSALLLPFALDALLDSESLDSARSRRAARWLGGILAAMLLTGAVHIAVETGVLAGLLGLTRPQSRRAVATGLALAAGLSLWRLIPAAFAFAGTSRPWMADGYPNGWRLLEGLGAVRSPLTLVDVGTTLIGGGRETLALRWFEFDAYVGGALLAMIAVFVPRWPRIAGLAEPAVATLRRFEWPLAICAGLAIARVYAAFVPAPYSLLSVVRVPARFVLPALATSLLIAIVRADAWWRARDRGPFAGAIAWLVVAAATTALVYHSTAVSPAYVSYPVTIPPYDGHLAPLPSGAMLSAHGVGLAGSLTTVVWMWRRR